MCLINSLAIGVDGFLKKSDLCCGWLVLAGYFVMLQPITVFEHFIFSFSIKVIFSI